jgi:hypothetical protein
MKKKDDVVTKKYLDEKLQEHAKIIVTAVDGVLDKKFKAVDFGFKEMREKFAENKADHKRLEDKIDKSWKSIDKYVKAQEAFREEFVVMKEEMRQIKQVLKEKLGVEIRAV